MKSQMATAAGFALMLGLVSSSAMAQMAQTAPPTYKGDPDVYKLIYEDANFRVIEAVRKKGVHDKTHSHPANSVVYNVTDCKTKLYEADGKTRDADAKAGTATPVPLTASHSAENTGAADCKQVFVEKK
jgi:mannose-6-phosphate isomerase-like protein (cupin superfamily)